MLHGVRMLGRLRSTAASYSRSSGLASMLRDGADAAAPAAAGCLRGFAMPSHMPNPDEKWPAGRRAAEGWWEDPAISTATQAFEIFDASLEKHKHLRQRHVQEIIKRCSSPEDLQLAVDAMDKLMRFRRAEQHHKPFNAHTGKMLVEQAVAIQAADVVAQAFRRSPELGLTPGSIQVQMVAKQLGMQGKFEEMTKLVAAARKLGIRTTPNMAYTVALTSIQVGQPERGHELMKEMELNGVRIRPIVWQHLEAALSGAGGAGGGGLTDDSPGGAAGKEPAADDTGSADSVGPAADDPGGAVDGEPAAAGRTSSAVPKDAGPTKEQREKEGATPEAEGGAPPGVAS